MRGTSLDRRRTGVLWCWLDVEKIELLSALLEIHNTVLHPSLPDCRRENRVGEAEESSTEIT